MSLYPRLISEMTKADMEMRLHREVFPPTIEEVRQQLGWDLIPNNAPTPARDDMPFDSSR